MVSKATRFRSTHWLWIAALWSGLGLFSATQTVVVMRAEGMHHAWGRLFADLVLAWLPWMLATPVVLHLRRIYPVTQWGRGLPWSMHLLACSAIGAASAGWRAVLDKWLNPWAQAPPFDPFTKLWRGHFENDMLANLILYGIVLLVGHLLDSRERLARQQTETASLSAQLSQAQLNALRRQIEPHFLFNTLNAIAGLVREKRNDDAVNMIVGLSDFLRRVIDDSGRQQVPLGEELQFAERYLDIQKVRFADRLQVCVEIPRELLPAQVPSLILQPMVENAIKHGIAKRTQGGMVRVAASRTNGTLTLSVYNDGPQLPADGKIMSSGIGISNVRTRLRGLYGSSFQFNIENRPPDGVEVSVSVPFTTSHIADIGS